LTSVVLSLRPMILLPGLYGSNLYATTQDYSKHWYCPSKMKNELFWVGYKFVIPPLYNCLFEMLRADYDESTDRVISPPGLSVDVLDFGGSDGISYVDTGIGGWHMFEVFGHMIDYLKKQGYTVKKNLFGCPYDWRLAMSGVESSIFPKMKALIENSYVINGESACLLGYSLGGFVINRFLNNYVTEEWKAKYVHKVIMLAPAYAGSIDTLDVAWNQYFPILPFLKTDEIKNTVQYIPALHVLFPNHVVYGNQPIIFGPNGEKVTAAQVPQFLIDHKKVEGKSIKMMLKNVEYSKAEPKTMKVPTYMLFNSGIETLHELKFNEGYDKDPVMTYQPGDGTVPSRGPLYACDHWGSEKYPIVCHDLKNSGDDYKHAGLGMNPYVHELIFKAAQDLKGDDWINVKGTTYIEAPHVDIINNTYVVKPTLRGEKRFTKIVKD